MTSSEFHDRLEANLQKLESRGQRRFAKTVHSQADGFCVINGRRLVNFGGNDYLNLAHEVGQQENVKAVFASQMGATASALVCGRSGWHHELEEAIARMEGAEAALLFPTGYAANLGVLGCLVESGDAVFSDRDNHASLIDAAKASSGKFYVYRRDRLAALSDAIARRRGDFDQVFIVTDGVFSMDGCIPDLHALCEIAQQHNCQLVVDEAHGTGVLGDHGRGACDFCNVEDRVLVRIGTMSKALGGIGGFAVADQQTIEWLRNSARTQFFSTALPPGICAAMLESVRVVESQPDRRHRLAQLTAFAHRRAEELKLKAVVAGVAPIVPILVNDDSQSVIVSQRMEAAGFFVPAIRPPTVPAGTARLRFSLTVKHSEEQIDASFCEVARILDAKF
ncbi:MAG: 8-amino-7-oxononanoate synthase [Fuerstiella sp.]